jgi:hypothetical protein
VFNILVPNRDDYLRNCGFLLERGRVGAFFLPTISIPSRIEFDNPLDLDLASSVAGLFLIRLDKAGEIIADMPPCRQSLTYDRGKSRTAIPRTGGQQGGLRTWCSGFFGSTRQRGTERRNTTARA